MATDYPDISVKNERRLGSDRASRMSQVSMYAETAHFVYELLQNADDAGATEIEFVVKTDALVIEHNGRVFNPTDVRNISYFGKGKTDRTKIGHFGLGFKSVFAYTASPHIYSGAESFEIRDLYSLAAAPYPGDLPSGRTRFVLPFDHNSAEPIYIERRNRKSPVEAQDEIGTKLAHLGPETLLFTSSLGEVRWETGDDCGHYRREIEVIAPSVREISIFGDEESIEYLVFDRGIEWPDDDDDTALQRRRPVEIAFRFSDRHTKGGRVLQSKTPLFVFFPTEKSAGLRFILQGPYRTTPARDNVPLDDPFNQHLVNVSADLLIDSLRWFRDNGILGLDLLSTLPLSPTPGFEPLHEAVRQALLTEPLLPAASGGYVSAMNAKLARGERLVTLFSTGQLAALFGKEGLRWIDAGLTEDRYGDLHSFLVGKKANYSWEPRSPALVKDIQVDADDIARRVDESFMSAQSDEWIIQLYAYLSDRGSAEFFRRPIIRLANRAHVSPRSNEGVPNAFLPLDSPDENLEGELPFVHATLARDAQARKFLEDVLLLTTPDICDVVVKNVLPHFSPGRSFSVETWRRCFSHIRAALRSPESAKQSELKRTLQSCTVLLAEDVATSAKVLVAPSHAYADNPETRTYFAGSSRYLLVASEYEETDLPILRELGVADRPRVTIKQPDYRGNVIMNASHGHHRRGLNGFDPDWTIDGLEDAVKRGSPAVALLLWGYILPLANQQLMSGDVEWSSEQFYKDPARLSVEASSGLLIRVNAWLPDSQGVLRRPAEITLEDLPDGFERDTERARKLAQQLGMALPHQDQILDRLCAGDPKRRQIIEQLFGADSSTWRKVQTLLASEAPQPSPPAGTFRDGVRSMSRRQREGASSQEVAGTIRNPERYTAKVEKELAEAIDESRSEFPRSQMKVVRVAPSNSEARAFLYTQYEGRCQVTGTTFRKADGTNYFEAVSLVPRLTAEHLNHPGNMLCLSAETAAKVMFGAFEWVDDLEAKLAAFRPSAEGGTQADRQIRIRVVGEEQVVTWTEQHFVRLVALWKLA